MPCCTSTFSSAVDRGLEPWSREVKEYKIKKYMTTGNYFDSNRTITENFQIHCVWLFC